MCDQSGWCRISRTISSNSVLNVISVNRVISAASGIRAMSMIRVINAMSVISGLCGWCASP